MSDPNLKIKHFRALMFPHAGIIFRKVADTQSDLVEASTVTAKLRDLSTAQKAFADAAKSDKATKEKAEKAVVDAHDGVQKAMTFLKAKSEEFTAAKKGAADSWLNDVFEAFGNLVKDVPKAVRPPSLYADDVLYIITTPEFALNGWVEGGIERYDAGAPFHESLEEYIRDQAHTRLKADFKHLHVVFTFSCCTYSHKLSPPHNAPGGPDKLTFNNRITIVTSMGSDPRTVTKSEPSDADKMRKDPGFGSLFTPAKVWDKSGKAITPNIQARVDEVSVGMSCFGDIDDYAPGFSRLTLGFGTCLDVLTDNHHSVNMIIVSGSELPLARGIKDTKHPFLLNDQRSWDEPKAGEKPLRGAGYYTYENPPLPSRFG